ncbi:hypothetical protein VdG1_04093 [Verticillium dahliae VDG1]|nr:hypothetical protein VdG1_04093 [Verticillium dahliae VDG1]
MQSAKMAPGAEKPVLTAEEKSAKTAKSSTRYPFWFGGSASSMAACVTHPLDLVKVRLQVRRPDAPKNMSGTVLHILRSDGPAGLYAGLSASLLRQMTYSTVRFGVYEELKTRAMRRSPNNKQPSPVDVIKTRVMTATTQEGLVKTLKTIYRNEGLGWMFKGWLPSFLRLGPQTICTFVFLEMHRKLYRKVAGLDEDRLKA